MEQKFKAALKAQPVHWNDGVLRFATITFHGPSRPALIAGRPVELAPERGAVTERLGCVGAVRELADGVRRGYSDAGWLRGRLAASGSLPDMVRESSELWAGRATAH